MSFVSMKNKILKKLSRCSSTYLYEYKVFEHFAHMFGKDLYLSSGETLVVKDFPRQIHFVIRFKDYISICELEFLKERARTLLKQGICTLVITEDNCPLDIMPAVNAKAKTFLTTLSGTTFSALESIFAERLALPRAKDL